MTNLYKALLLLALLSTLALPASAQDFGGAMSNLGNAASQAMNGVGNTMNQANAPSSTTQSAPLSTRRSVGHSRRTRRGHHAVTRHHHRKHTH